MDLANIGRAEKVYAGKDSAHATISIPGTDIELTVLYIRDLWLQEIYKPVLMEVVGMLPPLLRYKIYKPIVHQRWEVRRRKQAQLAELKAQLAKLETEV